jgi:hypothetical protein
MSRPAVGLNQAHIQRVLEALASDVMQSRHEGDRPPPPDVEVKN